MIFGWVGTGYGAYRGAKTSPGRAAGYAILGGFVGGLLDGALILGAAVALQETQKKKAMAGVDIRPALAGTGVRPALAGGDFVVQRALAGPSDAAKAALLPSIAPTGPMPIPPAPSKAMRPDTDTIYRIEATLSRG